MRIQTPYNKIKCIIPLEKGKNGVSATYAKKMPIMAKFAPTEIEIISYTELGKFVVVEIWLYK